MSEPVTYSYYRIKHGPGHKLCLMFGEHYPSCYERVEPCEHGKLDGHPVACDFCGIDGCADDYEWCPGAGIGGDE